MPAKKKQPKGKVKSPASKSTKRASPPTGGEHGEVDGAVASEREVLLQQEHDRLAFRQETLRKRLDALRHDNEFLQEEAQRTRVESQEYISYMSKRNQKRQDTIITLSDHNQKELEEIGRQREEVLAQLTEKEAELNRELLQKEGTLVRINREIKELEPIKDLQREQLSRIKTLEQEVMAARAKNAESVLQAKSAFMQEKEAYMESSEEEVRALAKEAQEQAEIFLKEHNEGVLQENQQLRQELLHLIRHMRIRKAHKLHLEGQHQQLMQESKYSQAMERQRRRRHLTPLFQESSIEEPEGTIRNSPTGHH